MIHRLFRTQLVAGASLIALASCATTNATTETATSQSSASETKAEFNMTEAHDVLIAEWSGPEGGLPPFDRVDPSSPADLEKALEEGIARQMADIDAIAADPAAPTFANVFVPLEKSGAELGRVGTLYGVMVSNMKTPEIQGISERISPKFAALSNAYNFNDALFARVKAVYDARMSSGLDAEQIRLVEKTYDNFVQSGAALADEPQARVGEINKQLATLNNDFSNRVVADESKFISVSAEAVSSLPASLQASFAAAATENGMTGYAVANTRSSVDPFLTFSDDRDARETVWRAFVNRGDNGDENDTNALIGEIVKLRAERAKLLGFESHAHYRMADTMAKTPDRAMDLMMRVWKPAVARVKEEVADMQALADKEGAGITIEPWDYRYYAEKVRKDRYALDQNEFKNYLELNNLIDASYYMADRLYGFQFKEVTGTVPTFHPDVRVYHVTNKDGSHAGYLYRDDFARLGKRSGAWQSTYRAQENIGGDKVHPIVSNNNNFTKGAGDAPTLISLDDAETLFHEFGHALHALSNNVTYSGLGGTPRDFVEFPSQVHENWLLTPEILDKYALHYKTGERMPQELIDKLNAARTFNQGFATVEYLSDAIIDMQLHMNPNPPADFDSDRFEREALAALGMPDEIVLRHRLPHFNHLFSSDAYSAGYYSYLWSDVMASDAWAAFEEAGSPWDPATAKKFQDIILATGDAIPRDEAYRQFRGRDPEVEALLKNRGFPTGE
ncbi:M3 family metallopeptidase [Pacificimonas sp. WHA3]|uniref:M3 family metallopeptidase n=1 Tax=Pacificimonas pallii TaxID=2827236 RepID=A0ABS6SEI2_9SPHN|nr:M3 family metallopeptidase [Pacificimonas pallii]MBV7256336.1 M3 family metallopeptidase [Pacificimonas pallii]